MSTTNVKLIVSSELAREIVELIDRYEPFASPEHRRSQISEIQNLVNTIKQNIDEIASEAGGPPLPVSPRPPSVLQKGGFPNPFSRNRKPAIDEEELDN